MIKCPVCNNELKEFDTLYKCNNNHSFDKNKKIYRLEGRKKEK